jgi:phage portal protein BeeE
LPLVTRTARALAAWLAPAYEPSLDLKPDHDQIEALTSEREALWAGIEKVSFLVTSARWLNGDYQLRSIQLSPR